MIPPSQARCDGPRARWNAVTYWGEPPSPLRIRLADEDTASTESRLPKLAVTGSELTCGRAISAGLRHHCNGVQGITMY